MEVVLEHELPRALFWTSKKKQIKKFQKNQRKYLGGGNSIQYHRAKLQYEISCILTSEKITKKHI
jgi:hypothetical protein